MTDPLIVAVENAEVSVVNVVEPGLLVAMTSGSEVPGNSTTEFAITRMLNPKATTAPASMILLSFVFIKSVLFPVGLTDSNYCDLMLAILMPKYFLSAICVISNL
jgi:hypothetical protein